MKNSTQTIYFSIWFLLLSATSINAQKQNLLPYVNPLIGTAKMGHTYPGATVPFGAVQLSPDTDTLQYEVNGKYNKDVYKYCAGYQYTDQTIVGFSHTHFSGTGHSDLGDIAIMPTTGALQLNPGIASKPQLGFRSKFSHQTEVAEPNYYKVLLEDHNILAELTTTERVGVHRYTFSKNEQAHIILDMVAGIYNYDNKNVNTFIRVENNKLITGYRQTNGWARTKTVFFAIAFSKPFTNYGYKNFAKEEVYKGFWRKFDQTKNFPEIIGKQIRAYFDFDVKEKEQILVKVAISPVSTAGALQNLRIETPEWNFDKIKQFGQEKWNTELNKIVVETLNENDKTNFYTAMYHAFLSPTIYMDTDNKYKGLDQNIQTAKGFVNYTTFSLWDTYRALHPLFNLVQTKRNTDMVQSLLAHYNQSAHSMLPVWSHYANENWCMIGYHSVSVIADAVIKGNQTADAEKLLAACVQTSKTSYYDGLGYYMKKGYVPEDKNSSSVSKTLEYAYDDWCIAQLAKHLGKTDIYNEYMKRSQNYKNVFDKSIGYMRPRLDNGEFKKEFDVLSTHGQGFIEGNAWNYSLYVPHNPDTLIRLMGGKKRFVQHLDSLFTMHLPDEFFADTEDITREGIMGNYVHGNEPSHHVPYLFTYAGAAWKTQAYIRQILNEKYKPTVEGLSGNDDCGQMSAWYIFSSLGFYPVAPGSDEYIIGSPLVKNATVNLENGKQFLIETINQSEKNVYIKSISLNGKVLTNFILKHSAIINGGKLVFEMSAKPKK